MGEALQAAGARLGPYEVVSVVGAGGMGDVYRARDTRLDRTVAIKVARERFEDRFRNEALAVAALNHPHVCTLFDVGPDYLVMEYVEGKALRGPLPVADVLRLAGQIADALEHAHRHGVVHRDLKPSNILLTKSGVKVLDFGLAKRRPIGPVTGDSRPMLTEEGAVLGTPRYMAPEQIDGKPADERSDIFAFGLVLYEMLTGQHAFEAKSAASVMAGILERDPAPISTLRPDAPPALEQVVLTCLAKDPGERWQSVRELKHALAWASRSGPVGNVRRRTWIAAALSAFAAAGLTLAVAHRRETVPKPPPVRFQISLPGKVKSEGSGDVTVSPDGRSIVLQLALDGIPHLHVRSLASLDLTPVPGSEGAFQAFFSPDGRQMAFFASGALKKVGPSGGPAQTLCQIPGLPWGATWNRDDVIVVSASLLGSGKGRLFRASARGGEPEPLGTLADGESARFWPQFLPDGRHYLYLSLAARPEGQGIYVGSLDSDLRKRIVATEYNAAYTSGHLLFVKDDALMAQPFDATSLELSGEPFPVLEQLSLFKLAGMAPVATYSVSANGVLAWRPRSTSMMEPKQLTWFDRSGQKLGTLGEPGAYISANLSPDERSVAVSRVDPASNLNNRRDIWILDVERGTSRRLTFDPADESNPVWSPDGTRIAFFSDRRGVREIYQKAADGSGEEELVLASKGQPLNLEDWSQDGRFLVYNAPMGLPNRQDLFLLPMSGAGERKPITFLATEAIEMMGAISPNGRWLAYRREVAGRGEIHVTDISPQGRSGPGKWQVSTGQGWQPLWRRDGRELLYLADSVLMAVAVKPDAKSFEAGAPRSLFDLPTPSRLKDRFVVARDGQRFLLSVPLQSPEPVRVLVNWLPPGR
jgi:eukaryotic-like serine/threonine-protein kinase